MKSVSVLAVAGMATGVSAHLGVPAFKDGDALCAAKCEVGVGMTLDLKKPRLHVDGGKGDPSKKCEAVGPNTDETGCLCRRGINIGTAAAGAECTLPDGTGKCPNGWYNCVDKKVEVDQPTKKDNLCNAMDTSTIAASGNQSADCTTKHCNCVFHLPGMTGDMETIWNPVGAYTPDPSNMMASMMPVPLNVNANQCAHGAIDCTGAINFKAAGDAPSGALNPGDLSVVNAPADSCTATFYKTAAADAATSTPEKCEAPSTEVLAAGTVLKVGECVKTSGAMGGAAGGGLGGLAGMFGAMAGAMAGGMGGPGGPGAMGGPGGPGAPPAPGATRNLNDAVNPATGPSSKRRLPGKAPPPAGGAGAAGALGMMGLGAALGGAAAPGTSIKLLSANTGGEVVIAEYSASDKCEGDGVMTSNVVTFTEFSASHVKTCGTLGIAAPSVSNMMKPSAGGFAKIECGASSSNAAVLSAGWAILATVFGFLFMMQ